MFKFIDGLPKDVLAIEATGKVTHEDYKSTLIPRAEAMMGKGPIKMLYVIGKEFTGPAFAPVFPGCRTKTGTLNSPRDHAASAFNTA